MTLPIHTTRLDIVVVGRPSEALRPSIADFEQRLGKMVRLEVHELRSEPLNAGEARSSAIEGDRILKLLDRLGDSGRGTPCLIACDSSGHSLSSERLASTIVSQAHVVCVVGGAAGLDRRVIDRATVVLAFGAVTLPHQIARLVLTEQCYRSFRIARGEPYHH